MNCELVRKVMKNVSKFLRGEILEVAEKIIQSDRCVCGNEQQVAKFCGLTFIFDRFFVESPS
jgi:hypothetical protein